MPYENGPTDTTGNHRQGHPRARPAAAPPALATPSGSLRRHRRTPQAAAGVCAVVPATVWVPPAHAIGPGWPQWVRDQARRSFLPTGGSWWDMTAALTDPTVRMPCPMPAPFWAALVDDPTAHATPITGPTLAPPDTRLRREAAPEPSAGTADPAAAPDPSPRSVDVVFADLTATATDTDTDAAPVDGWLGMIAARMLRGGGILAVLTRCRPHADGALVDTTGEIVASAQNADLLYLQHIVIPTGPLHGAGPTDATASPDLDRSTAHRVAHADLLVFARPRTANTHFSPGMAAAGETTTCGAPCAVAAGASNEVRR